MQKNIKKILKNKKSGYTLMYTLVAMVVCCALVFSTISISAYYNNNLARKTGNRGAIFAAQSGIEVTEDYLNYCYNDSHRGGSKTTKELYTRIYDILNDLIVTGEDKNENDRTGLVLQGYSNYEYTYGAGGVSAQLIPDTNANISYKTYYSKTLMNNIKTRGELTILSLGEYVQNNKAYYKFVTVTVLIQPNYNANGKIDSFDFKTIQYNETLKGGTELWGSVQW